MEEEQKRIQEEIAKQQKQAQEGKVKSKCLCQAQFMRFISSLVYENGLPDIMPMGIWSTDRKLTDIKSTDIKSTDIKSTDIKSTDIKLTDIKSIDILPNGREIDRHIVERTSCRTDIVSNGHSVERI